MYRHNCDIAKHKYNSEASSALWYLLWMNEWSIYIWCLSCKDSSTEYLTLTWVFIIRMSMLWKIIWKLLFSINILLIVLLNIFVETVIHYFRILWWIESSKEPSLSILSNLMHPCWMKVLISLKKLLKIIQQINKNLINPKHLNSRRTTNIIHSQKPWSLIYHHSLEYEVGLYE